MTPQRASEIERAVFYKYLDIMERDLDGADTNVVFQVGRTLGYMQKALSDELSKEVEHYEGKEVSE
jgi:hypothetical protein